MICNHFRESVSQFLDSELSFSERKDFNGHGENCVDCSMLLARMENAKALLGNTPADKLSIDFVQRLQHRLRQEETRSPAWWRRMADKDIMGFSPISLTGMAAASIIAIALSISLFSTDAAPIIDAPKNSTKMMAPSPANGMNRPLFTGAQADSVFNAQDSTRKTQTPPIKYVSKGQNP